ncbi:MAG: peptidylprolyl isomerase [Egibacteraceae bacterium]
MPTPRRTLAPRGLVVLLLLTMLAVGCARGDSNVAATVAGVEISVAELNKQVEDAMRVPQIAEQVKGNREITRQLEITLLGRMIATTLLDQAAKELGVTATDQELRSRLDQVIAESGGPQAYEQRLSAIALTEQSALAQIRMSVLSEKMADKLGQSITVSDVSADELNSAYARQFSGAGPVARHILLATQEEAQGTKDRIVKGEDFAVLAKQLSKDTATGQLGGLLGEIPPGQTVPEFEQAVNAAKENEVVGPVKTQFGFHIIQRLPSPPSHDLVDDALREQLVQQRQGQAFQDYITKQREKTEVEVNPRFGEWDPKTGEVRPAEPLGGLESNRPAPAE